MGMRRRDVSKVLFSVALPLFVALWAAPAPLRADSPPRLYPGVTAAQSQLAHEALRAWYDGRAGRAELLLGEMDDLEESDSLPPLSRLLRTATIGFALQRDDAKNAAEKARWRARLDSAAEAGLARCARRPGSGSDPTCLLIEGGIIGFRAVLDLGVASPVTVLRDGLRAVDRLERALALDSGLTDAHMGLGMFHVMAASNTPAVVRGILRVLGRGLRVREGLAHLRRSGYEGQYTSVASQFYLIRFLSPYDDESRREKAEIFRSLRATFPRSPLPLFLQGHEFLCFHPDRFYGPGARAALARALRAAEADPEENRYAAARALVLAKHQYTLLDPAPAPRYAPDTSFDLGGYAFYPDFIEALRLRRELLRPARAGASPQDGAERAAKVRRVAILREDLATRIRAADLNPRNREHLAWQVRDALRPELFEGLGAGRANQAARDSGAAVSTSNAAGKSRGPADR